MEIYSKTTRFALACNNSEKIIEPIQSRCAVLRYAKLTDAQVLARILDVVKSENVDYANDGLEAILFTAQGDMRQALNNLQGLKKDLISVYRFKTFKKISGNFLKLQQKSVTFHSCYKNHKWF